jgi:glycosyltransferase involved in cell wall biosynthesis
MSPSLFTGVAAGLAARIRGASFVYDIEDFHPDVATEVGALKSEPVILALRALERLVIRLSSHLVVISEGFRELATRRGADPDRVSVVPNWADPQFFDVPEAQRATAVTAMFIGTHGLAQDLDVLVDVAALCPDVNFAFVGDGVAKAAAVRRAKSLSNVTFHPSQPHESISAFLSHADVALVALRPGHSLSATIPSKTYEYLAAARPVLAVAGGEVSQLLDGAGVCVPQGSTAAIVADALRKMLDREARVHMGRRARVIAREFTRDVVVARYIALLDRLR